MDLDLASLHTQLRKGKGSFNYSPYRALVRLMVQKAPWRSTLSSRRGNEQTRKLVEERIFGEIKSCTHKDVGGFDAKYFRNTSWEEKFIDIYKKIRKQDDTGLSDFPDPPIQDDVLDWWFRLQDTFLMETRGIYYSTEGKKSIKDSDADRQVDVLMRVRTGENAVPTHSWKDIRVVGELKQSNYDKKGTLLQIERYV